MQTVDVEVEKDADAHALLPHTHSHLEVAEAQAVSEPPPPTDVDLELDLQLHNEHQDQDDRDDVMATTKKEEVSITATKTADSREEERGRDRSLCSRRRSSRRRRRRRRKCSSRRGRKQVKSRTRSRSDRSGCRAPLKKKFVQFKIDKQYFLQYTNHSSLLGDIFETLQNNRTTQIEKREDAIPDSGLSDELSISSQIKIFWKISQVFWVVFWCGRKRLKKRVNLTCFLFKLFLCVGESVEFFTSCGRYSRCVEVEEAGSCSD